MNGGGGLHMYIADVNGGGRHIDCHVFEVWSHLSMEE